jgi:hypothetical protein
LSGALIITADIDPRDLGWLDELRRAHYPPNRNRLAAHLTIFHALPPSAEAEARRALARLASEPRPRASIEGLLDFGSGVAFRVVSSGLDRIRLELAENFHGLLNAQDLGGWRPHVTIQNKVPPKDARRLIAQLRRDFSPRPLAIVGLGLHRYHGEQRRIASYVFRGVNSSRQYPRN